MSYPRILVVTSCTGKKQFKPDNQLSLEDFKNSSLLSSRTGELEEFVCCAHQMYRGVQHLRLMEGVTILRQALKGGVVDLVIVSAGYGLIPEDQLIAPYEVTFNTMKGCEIDQWATEQKIRESLETTIRSYDLVFVLLGEKYLRSLQLPIQTLPQQKIIFFASPNSLKYLRSSNDQSFAVLLSNIEARQYGYGLVGLKGFLFKQFAQKVAEEPQLIQDIYAEPTSFSSFFDTKYTSAIQLSLLPELLYDNCGSKSTVETNGKSQVLNDFHLYRATSIISTFEDSLDSSNTLTSNGKNLKNAHNTNGNSSALAENIPFSQRECKTNGTDENNSSIKFVPRLVHLNQYSHFTRRGRSEIDTIIPLPNTPPAKNYHHRMQYFIPEWDDHVDPDYKFVEDKFTPNRDPHDDEVYAHEIFSPSRNYDGILVSRTIFDKSKKKKERILAEGIRCYIRFEGSIMGDCGAFGYIGEEEPPYKTEDILTYYDKVGFDYGVSIDHLIVGNFAKPGIREKRYELTRNNAKEFFKKHQAGNYEFIPIGAVQGWDAPSYASAVKEYIEIGYKHIALGGLARARTPEIIEILHEISPLLTPETKLHLFGVGRLNAIPIFRHLGVTSFDSASPLRKAWLDPAANYHSWDDKIYAAVRIPSSNSSRVKRIIKAGITLPETLQELEKKALWALRKFDAGELKLDATLQALLNYDKLLELPREGKVDPTQLEKRLKKHEKMYRKLLEDQPWKKCNCKICSDIGVESIIFRGNDRNRRRGFHNTYVFYKRFQELLKEYEIIENENYKTLVMSE